MNVHEENIFYNLAKKLMSTSLLQDEVEALYVWCECQVSIDGSKESNPD